MAENELSLADLRRKSKIKLFSPQNQKHGYKEEKQLKGRKGKNISR